MVARPVGNFKNSGEYHYQTLRCRPALRQQAPACSRRCRSGSTLRRFNVDMLKLIQLGMTFVDAQGTLPTFDGELCCWQFNFRRASGFSCQHSCTEA